MKPIVVFMFLVLLFLAYSVAIYTSESTKTIDQDASREMAQGRLVWQKYNCQSCHQLYGLGGYLGPDLTNFAAHPAKDKRFLQTMLLSNIKQMPVFKLDSNELHRLYTFLTRVNQTGNGHPSTYTVTPSGMIEQHE